MSTSSDVLNSVSAQAPAQPNSSSDVLNQVASDYQANMVGPKGQRVTVQQSEVPKMRQQNYAVTPDTKGAVRMVTPEGKLTYALPNEVQGFKSSGHVPIDANGRYEIQPLPGEDFADTAARAVKIAKGLGPLQQKAEQAEMAHYTSKEGLKDEAKGLANVGLTIGGQLSGYAAAGKIAQATGALGAKFAATEAGQQFLSSPKLYAEYVLKNAGPEVAKQAGKYLLKKVAPTVGTILAAKWLWKLGE
jgi:hypothetical protein